MIIANAGLNEPTLCFTNADGKSQTFRVIGFDVDDKGTVRPIHFPALPKNAKCWLSANGGYFAYDPATGLTSGTSQMLPGA